ncbi:Imm50 family immunity protein [Streptomyces sp. ME02-6991-2A]|uniref:Imm50 family immunity protein n=1 Tax=Streptomyces sp. ME02-6991-2A TaxID=3028677 RepID=UPI0029A816ED|nr:Imm50 family immunity protein [Streptomyces sp. ME02-6991-2A]MDX3374286.1 Imm50 family immunity protein [Streptomyces sp. ME02-6991-2A]
MSESSWAQFLDDPSSIHTLYDEEPDLDQSDLFHFLADEREASITLGFQTGQTPARARPEWEGTEYNSFTFYLAFSGVQGLTIQGWAAPAHKKVSIRRDPDEKLAVTIESEGTSVAFRARALSLTSARAGLVSRPE